MISVFAPWPSAVPGLFSSAHRRRDISLEPPLHFVQIAHREHLHVEHEVVVVLVVPIGHRERGLRRMRQQLLHRVELVEASESRDVVALDARGRVAALERIVAHDHVPLDLPFQIVEESCRAPELETIVQPRGESAVQHLADVAVREDVHASHERRAALSANRGRATSTSTREGPCASRSRERRARRAMTIGSARTSVRTLEAMPQAHDQIRRRCSSP